MNSPDCAKTIQRLTLAPKGILAADENPETMDLRFEPIGVESNPETRRTWREILFSAEDFTDSISGVILHEEQLRQRTDDGMPFPDFLEKLGVVAGAKVDTGAYPLAGFPDETVTEGLDGLRDRLKEFSDLGARFAKWRAPMSIGDGRPSAGCIQANAHALARYAALCQEQGMVPIVEPDLVRDGTHDLSHCRLILGTLLEAIFSELARQKVALEHIILKPSMVTSGQDCAVQARPEEVGEATVSCLRQHVPTLVPAVFFLSGGQSEEEATKNLKAINELGPHPWGTSFCFGRALQQKALRAWSGDPARVQAAQTAFVERSRANAQTLVFQVAER